MAIRERRKVQRIRFAKPLTGRVRARRVSVLDLSTEGMCIQHQSTLKTNMDVDVELDWNGETIRLEGVVTRCVLSHYTGGTKPLPIYHSGVRFAVVDEDAHAQLRALVEDFLQRSLDEGREIGGGKLPIEIGGIPLALWLRNKLK